MTRLPIDSWQVKDRPDLPPYPLNTRCPVTAQDWDLENHHIWRKGFGTKSWWVELEDGTVVGNRIHLSSAAHERVTVNKARIAYENGLFYWIEAGEKVLLPWQPPKYGQVVDRPKHEVHEGETCPTCNRRIPHKKKKSSPKTKVFSIRVPTDDAETFSELVNAAAEHHGIKEKPHYSYWVMHYGVTLLLQSEKGELPA